MTPTPNPTAENVIGAAMQLAAISLGQTVSGSPRAGDLARYILRHGNAASSLSEGAPSEEQIERASRAFYAAAWLDKDAGLDDGRTVPEMVRDGVRAALTAAGIAPQGSAAAASALCDEVIAGLGDNIQTHGPECYRWHVGCLALRVRQALAHERDLEEAASISRSLSPEALEAKRVAYLADQEREKLIAEATERINEWSAESQCPSDIGMIVRLRDALAAQPVLDAEADLRDVAHISCDCVPDLGPEHCHLCSDREGHEVTWTECSSHLLDPVKVAEVIAYANTALDDLPSPGSTAEALARALCEAYTEGKLSA